MVVSVEEVASSLVREFLSRKGLKRTIACMDEEFPRTGASINNRSDLRQILQIEGLYRLNKATNCPLKTLLEIIVKSHIAGHNDDHASCLDDPLCTSLRTNLNTLTNSHADKSNPQYITGVHESSRVVPKIHQNPRSIGPDSGSPHDMSLPERSAARQTCLPGADQEPSVEQQQEASPQVDVSLPRREREKAANDGALKSRTSRVRRGVLGGPVANSSQDPVKKRQTRRTVLTPSVHGNESGPSEHTWPSKGLGSWSTADQEATPEGGSLGEAPAAGLLRDRQSPGRQDVMRNARPKSSTSLKMDSSPSSEMVLDDFDYDEELPELSHVSLQPSHPQHSFSTCHMDLESATALKEVFLGSGSRCFCAEWRNQGFTFSETPDLGYGIVQRKGGPCGVLASVQACVLQKLLFDGPNPGYEEHGRLRPSDAVRRRCLVLAVAEMLWRAGEHKTATLAITSGRSHFLPSGHYKSEGLLEKVTCFTTDNLNTLQCLLEQHIQQYESGSLGCLLLTISAVLCRSIAKVREDMDVSSNTLIGAHGYCTQELVNLLLCGQAVSNVFDGQLQLDSSDGGSTLLKGIPHRCHVGLLSLFEHHNICEVGGHLKSPLFPIWVVCSESHFSTLFGLQREQVDEQDGPQEFDLYYYDGLANQQEEIRLSVATGLAAAFLEGSDPDLTPPLEQCIQTKWKDAVVNWNDTEPIL